MVPGLFLFLLKQAIEKGRVEMPVFIDDFAKLDRRVLRSVLLGVSSPECCLK